MHVARCIQDMASHPGRGSVAAFVTIRLKELLGHVGAAALVDDVRCGKKDLACDDKEDEEAHAWSRGGDGW